MVLEIHILTKEKRLHHLKWMLFPHAQRLECAPNVIGAKAGFGFWVYQHYGIFVSILSL